MARGKFISYLRVSTQDQGADGNGVAAQRAAVEAHLNGGRWTLVREYVEVLSGKRDDRPELRRAIRHAKATGATLICSKLDRIGRKASTVLGLLDNSGITVVFADSPQAGKLELGVRAVVAEEEGRAISERTRSALQAVRARVEAGGHVSRSGRPVTRLGNPNGAAALKRHVAEHGNAAGVEGARRAAREAAEGLRWVVEELAAEGVTSNKAVSRALNERGFPSPRGGRWQATSVRRLRDRLALADGGPS